MENAVFVTSITHIVLVFEVRIYPTTMSPKYNKSVPLWPLKLHYFLYGAGGAPILPFLPIIGKQMGISGRGLGFILALVQIIGLIIK